MLYRLAHYEIVEEIGHGGMGVVYRARDTKLGRMVAIKVLPSLLRTDPERRSRLLREARAAANLNHPNIATVYEVNEALLIPVDAVGSGVHPTVESLYIAMEYVDGRDLHDLLADGPLPVAETIDFGIQIADALDLAHRGGIVHRDLKPRNVRITAEGRVKILDFGLAKVLHDETRIAPMGEALAGESVRTAAGMIVGTVPYMAPEQVDGTEVDARSDLFSLGVVLYQMATGKVPYEGGTLVKFVQALGRGKPLPMRKLAPEIPPALESIVARLLARDPAKRQVSAGVVLRELRELEGSGATTLVDTATITVPGWFVGWRRWAAATAAVLVTIVASAAISLRMSDERGAGGVGRVSRVRIVQTTPPEDAVAAAPCLEVGGLITAKLLQDTEFTVVDRTGSDPRPGDIDIALQCQLRDSDEQVFVQLTERDNGWLFWTEEPLAVAGSGRALSEEIAHRTVRALVEFSRFRERHGALGAGARNQALNRFEFGKRLLEQFNDPRDLAQSISAFRRAIELDPGYASAYAGLSLGLWRLYQNEGDAELRQQAIEAAEEAARLDGEQPLVRIASARVCRMTGDLECARDTLERLVQDHPDLADAHLEMAYYHWQLGDGDRAMDSFRTAIRSRPEHWRLYNELGIFLLRSGDFEGARQNFERAIDRLPEGVFWPIENLGNTDLYVGEYERALATYERIPIDLMSASLSANRGTALYMLQRWSEALAAYRQAVALAPENPIFRNNLGDAQWMAGRRDDAEETFRETLDLLVAALGERPEHPLFKSLRLPVLAKVGQCTEMARLAAQLEALAPPPGSSPTTYDFHIAKGYALCDRPAKALSLLETLSERGIQAIDARTAVELQPLLGNPDFERIFPRPDRPRAG